MTHSNFFFFPSKKKKNKKETNASHVLVPLFLRCGNFRDKFGAAFLANEKNCFWDFHFLLHERKMPTLSRTCAAAIKCVYEQFSFLVWDYEALGAQQRKHLKFSWAILSRMRILYEFSLIWLKLFGFFFFITKKAILFDTNLQTIFEKQKLRLDIKSAPFSN